MTNGSIYIDPDGVSSVSSQMLKTADEIDALRQNIVPQVYSAIEMSYPSLNVLPQVGPPVGSAHENIGYFVYEAETVAHELRTSAYVLNQVANEGRLMMEQLLQQATLFTTPGQSISSRGGKSGSTDSSIWQQLANLAGNAGAVLGFVGSLVELLKNVKYIKDIHAFLEDTSWASPVLFALGFGLDFASGGPHHNDYTPHAFVSDLYGNGLGYAIGLTGVGTVIIVASGIIQIGGDLLGAEQIQLADTYGDSRLKDPGTGLQTAASNANIGQFLDDVGGLFVDSYGVTTGNPGIVASFASMNIASTIAFGVPVSNPANLPTDVGQTLTDGGKLLISPVQFVANLGAAEVDNYAVQTNQIIQNLPLPSSLNDVKSFSNTVSNGTINVMNDIADAVTKTDDVNHLWNWAKSAL